MKANLYSQDGKKLKQIELPRQFNEEIRPDIISRAVLAIQSHKRQRYGTDPWAGSKYSSKLSKRRRKYRGSYGFGISRVQRKILTRRGTQFFWVGATTPNTVGGRKAHPPKPEKIFSKKINIKERRKAIRSAIAATAVKELVVARGHKCEEAPLIIETRFESMNKTKDVQNILIKLGLEDELKRIANRRITAGRGKSRGRRYKTKKGPLLIVSENCALIKAASNLQGVDIATVNSLNAEVLAPGCRAGRLTIWTDKAIERLAKEELYND